MLTKWTNAFSSTFSSCFPTHLCLDDARIVSNAQEVAATGSLAYLLCEHKRIAPIQHSSSFFTSPLSYWNTKVCSTGMLQLVHISVKSPADKSRGSAISKGSTLLHFHSPSPTENIPIRSSVFSLPGPPAKVGNILVFISLQIHNILHSANCDLSYY